MKRTFLFLLSSALAVPGCSAMSGDDAADYDPSAYANCQIDVQKTSVDPTQCVKNGQVPVYSNRFSSSCGASSVVSGSDAAAGLVSHSASTTPSPSIDAPTAMTVSCGEAACAAGQVAVVDPTAGASGSTSQNRCVDAPPTCSGGESPQFVFSSSTWECTGCNVVITYGATYGNYSRCASEPTLQCPSGQVPTWAAEAEQWECQTTCDNGDYDQHSVNGSTVCVPC